ncbi:MAG: putative transposase [Thermosediminibacterales bacterium]|nr:putative transposase [Thermosediminibacterales bacterium]
MNAYIESFHSILKDECCSRIEFKDFAEAYRVIAEYMDYYNTRRNKLYGPREILSWQITGQSLVT